MTFELYRDAAGEWRWRLVAENGEPIADSGEGYKRKSDCLEAIALIREEVAEAEVLEVSL